MAAPAPSFRPVDDPGVDGVQREVLQCVDEVLVAPDEAVGVSLGEDASVPAVPLVEAAGVRAVQVAHAGAEISDRCSDEQVIVRPHQTPAHQLPAVPSRRAGEQSHEVPAIAVIDEELAPADGSGGQVEGSAGAFGSEWASHRSRVPVGRRRRNGRRQINAISAQTRRTLRR
jgi:hypothetical protein